MPSSNQRTLNKSKAELRLSPCLWMTTQSLFNATVYSVCGYVMVRRCMLLSGAEIVKKSWMILLSWAGLKRAFVFPESSGLLFLCVEHLQGKVIRISLTQTLILPELTEVRGDFWELSNKIISRFFSFLFLSWTLCFIENVAAKLYYVLLPK